jgi:opacity protein-like surface antigen
MKRLMVSALMVAAAAAPAAAQQATFSSKPAVFTIAPYVGYMNFGDYFETTNGVEFSNENGALYGAQAQLDLGRYVSLIGNFGYTSSKFTFENYFGPGNDLNLSDVGVWLYDGGIQFRLPLRGDATSGVSPFVQAGAGAVRWSSESDDITSKSSTNAAFNYGAGLDWQLGKLGIRLMAKDYVTSLDWSDFGNVELEDTKAHNWALTAGFKIGF